VFINPLQPILTPGSAGGVGFRGMKSCPIFPRRPRFRPQNFFAVTGKRESKRPSPLLQALALFFSILLSAKGYREGPPRRLSHLNRNPISQNSRIPIVFNRCESCTHSVESMGRCITYSDLPAVHASILLVASRRRLPWRTVFYVWSSMVRDRGTFCCRCRRTVLMYMIHNEHSGGSKGGG